MKQKVDFGPRLSSSEYDRRIVALHRGQPPMPGEEEELELRRRELDITIDYRLGREFPPARREKLFQASCSLRNPGLGFLLRHLIGRLTPAVVARNAQFLADDVVRAYGKVLSKEELAQFLDLEEGERPALPVDLQNLKR